MYCRISIFNTLSVCERITHAFNLEPFGEQDIREYVNFRLRQAGYRGRDVFQRRFDPQVIGQQASQLKGVFGAVAFGQEEPVSMNECNSEDTETTVRKSEGA